MVVIANLYGEGDLHNDKARQEYREIKMNVLLQRQEGERSYADMFRRYYKRVLIAMSAQALAQLNGINVISYYAPLVFEVSKLANRLKCQAGERANISSRAPAGLDGMPS